ncbi:uncharacterized protein C8A04DRAFT_38624 [Dichotomopilus funicola]|uniref:F-box domain-containing protein n=1 Tax=Dichotomopilus funicola TaxID=1934379 RepID=A0AAN6UZX9_9PEZI|nr:hypothetical protein C8A04DRAFT_38624 [Dichotomopilus funicola]
MSPRISSCPICGWRILAGFLIERCLMFISVPTVYSGPEGYVLTGVGIYNDAVLAAFIAPPNPNARYDDPGYVQPATDEFGAMTDIEVDGRRGFVFHEVCWSLLEKAYHLAQIVPIHRVWEVCNSIPLSMAGDSLNWGHDYGGLAIQRDNFFPWEPRFANRHFPHGQRYPPIYDVDPRAPYELDDILAEHPQHPPRVSPSLFLGSQPNTSSNEDPFISLPAELCSLIARYLPTADALNLRLASRRFWHIYDSQQFWVSRFKGNSDRSWLSEVHAHDARPKRTSPPDWRWLYRCTTNAHRMPGLQNRKRIWSLIQGIIPLLALRWNEVPCPLPTPWQRPSETTDKEEAQDPSWAFVGGFISHESNEFCQLGKAGRRLHSERVVVPAGISHVAVSTVHLTDWGYIAGISLTSMTGAVLRLGYGDFDAQSSAELPNKLAGFNVAVGVDGIHGLQCVDTKLGSVSKWLGCTHDVPKTERLAVGTPIAELELGFDVCEPFKVSTPSLSRPISVRLGLSTTVLSRFGGPGGIYLQHLTKLTVRGGGLQRIEFSFNIDVPVECWSFGRWENTEFTEFVDFNIDGAGGELIDRVEIGQVYEDRGPNWCREAGDLGWIHTNRGRTCETGRKQRSRKSVIKERVVIAGPGRVVTGFYGAQYRNLAIPITVLGVITEASSLSAQ